MRTILLYLIAHEVRYIGHHHSAIRLVFALRWRQRARIREPYTEGLARAFFARIATDVGDPQAISIVKESAEIVPRLPSAGAIYVVQSLVNPTKRKELQATAASRVAKRVWHWDAITNTLRMLDS